MTYDHQAVAGGREVDPELVRMHRLLDEVILPRLERPGRFIEPLRARGIGLESAVEHRPLLLWPSAPEGADPASKVLRLRDALERVVGVSVSFAYATPPDLRVQLRAHGLLPFSLPDWLPITRHPLWLVWLEQPSQVLGVAATLVEARVALVSADRADQAPLLIAAGPGATVAMELAASFADAVLADPAVDNAAAALGELLSERDDAARRLRVGRWIEGGRARGPFATAPLDAAERAALRDQLPPLVAEPPTAPRAVRPELPKRTPRVQAAGAPGPGATSTPVGAGRRPTEEALQACFPGHTSGPWLERRDQHLWVARLGAASACLRSSLGLPAGDDVASALADAFTDPSARLDVHLAVGLPGETAADRASIFLLAEQLATLLPDATRRVTLRPSPYVDGGQLHPSEAWQQFEQAAERGTGAAAAMLCREPVDHDSVRFDAALAGAPGRAAGLLLALAGLQLDMATAVGQPDPHTWRAALAGALAPPAEQTAIQSEAVPPPSVSPAATGLEAACERARAVAAERTPAGGGAPAAPTAGDVWARWHSLVPRHFDYRLEFEKRGRLRHLSHRELAEAFLRACRRAHLPVATTGVARPRPRLTFGPPLPVGIEGLQEFVDLGLAHKVPHLRPTLNEWLPDGLLVNRASFIPPGASRNALSHPAAAQYEVDLPGGCWRAGGEGHPRLLQRIQALQAAERWPVAGREGLDAKAQVTDLTVHTGDADVVTLAFTLDLSSPTAKVGPGELLDMLLADLVQEVRLLRVRRTRLLVQRPEDAAALSTPSEQVLQAHHELREKAKHCA